jgi:hypothetical protein
MPFFRLNNLASFVYANLDSIRRDVLVVVAALHHILDLSIDCNAGRIPAVRTPILHIVQVVLLDHSKALDIVGANNRASSHQVAVVDEFQVPLVHRLLVVNKDKIDRDTIPFVEVTTNGVNGLRPDHAFDNRDFVGQASELNKAVYSVSYFCETPEFLAEPRYCHDFLTVISIRLALFLTILISTTTKTALESLENLCFIQSSVAPVHKILGGIYVC